MCNFHIQATHKSKVNKLNVASSIQSEKVAFTQLWLSIQSNVIALGWSTVHSGAAEAAAARDIALVPQAAAGAVAAAAAEAAH